MASSPSCSSTVSPKDEDVFSDDSGVDVKPRHLLLDVRETASHHERRNKRKSSEPKRRKDVLLMKRFRWEDTDEDEEEEEEEDVKDEVKEEEEDDFLLQDRPGSGDSGCCREEDVAPPAKSKRTKPAAKEVPRQSVIRKNEAPPPCTTDLKKAAGSSGCPGDDAGMSSVGRPSRNYKSMSRQRRIEANARERTRVHTIGAAFESLRRAVPAYAHNQKLSKLAILRIASAYIVALACLSGGETEGGGGGDSMPDCVERCTRTIQAEGRSRRRTSKD